jgi:hypothetical protein
MWQKIKCWLGKKLCKIGIHKWIKLLACEVFKVEVKGNCLIIKEGSRQLTDGRIPLVYKCKYCGVEKVYDPFTKRRIR